MKENCEIVSSGSNFRGPVLTAFAHVAGSQSIDRLFHFLLLNVYFPKSSKAVFLGIEEDVVELFPQVVHNFSILCKICSKEQSAVF